MEKCICCGAVLSFDESVGKYICEYCNAEYTREEYAEYLDKKERIVKETIDEVHKDQRLLDAEKKAASDRRIAEEQLRIKEQEAEIERRNAAAEAENRAKIIQARKTAGADVEGMMENMKGAFFKADAKGAANYANNVLAHDADNILAKFVAGYCDVVLKNNYSSLDAFMDDLPGVSVDNDSIKDLLGYIKAVYPKMMAYEEPILKFIYNNRQQPATTCEFTDSLSPLLVSKRTNRSFMTEGLKETYKNLAAFCSIPKTCYALIGGIQNNPESPLKNGEYYAKTANTKFYNEYVVTVSEIVSAMENDSYRTKFSDACDKLAQKYKAAAQI